VYDLSKFAEIHPGGISVLLDADVGTSLSLPLPSSCILHASLPAGKECTAVFFGLHRQEILYNERYAKLVIGQIENEEQLVRRNEAGSLSEVPYAEPMWLTPGFKRSPYFKESHYAVQKGKSRDCPWRLRFGVLMTDCRGAKVCR
jgi:hypothetical protein